MSIYYLLKTVIYVAIGGSYTYFLSNPSVYGNMFKDHPLISYVPMAIFVFRFFVKGKIRKFLNRLLLVILVIGLIYLYTVYGTVGLPF